MDSKSRPQLPPPILGKGAGMAHAFAAAIRSTGAKRDAQFERLALASDVLDAQGIILVGTSFGASVPSEQVDPSSTDAGLKGRVFIHESGADSAFFRIKDLSVRSCVRPIARWSPHSAQKTGGWCAQFCIELAHPTRFERVTFAFGGQTQIVVGSCTGFHQVDFALNHRVLCVIGIAWFASRNHSP